MAKKTNHSSMHTATNYSAPLSPAQPLSATGLLTATHTAAVTHTYLSHKVRLALWKVEQLDGVAKLSEVRGRLLCVAAKHAVERLLVNPELQGTRITEEGLTGHIVEQLPAQHSNNSHITNLSHCTKHIRGINHQMTYTQKPPHPQAHSCMHCIALHCLPVMLLLRSAQQQGNHLRKKRKESNNCKTGRNTGESSCAMPSWSSLPSLPTY